MTIFILFVCLVHFVVNLCCSVFHQLFVLGFNYVLIFFFYFIFVDFKSQPQNLLHVSVHTSAPFAIYLCFITKVFVCLPCCFFSGPACCRLTGTGMIHCDKLHRIATERGYLKFSRAEQHLLCCGFWSYHHHRACRQIRGWKALCSERCF